MNCSYDMEMGPLGINYLEFHYCSMAGWAWASCLVLAAWLVLLFYLLGNTADEYFSPTLSTLCTQFHIPFDVAGVTLLAFGNGAPDVFSSLASSSSGAMETGLNALLGGVMFVTTMVVGAVLVASTSPVVAIAPRAFCRDVLSLLVVVGLIILCVLEASTMYMAAFPLVYTIYVLLVVLPTCWAAPAPDDAHHGVLFAFWHAPQLFETSPPAYKFVTMTSTKPSTTMARQAFDGAIFDTYFGPSQETLAAPLLDESSDDVVSPPPRQTRWYGRWHRCSWRHVRYLLLDLPRELTIPMVVVRRNGWSRRRAALSVTTTSVFVLWLGGLLDAHPRVYLAVVSASFGLSLAVYVGTYHRTAPTSRSLIMGFYALGFVACVAWIYGLAAELVSVLAAVGHITTLPPSVVGLTILSWGNSIGDWSTNVAIARGGCPEMALAGCFGGPVFNLLIGLGLPMLLARLASMTSRTHVPWDVHCKVSLGFLVLSLVSTLSVVALSRFQCPRWYGKVLFGMYMAYTSVHLILLLHAP
ncbi:hypothetical protein SPRG_07944 [Saprolegnia parasitica CBS 223.65]|uniref:Sodium/calcium exchanger membrane region domain-containing protein n=1 Tax=Saprolegnia parasitica (strain CBS 223.65) TaxID=695850 RepID=A0A067CI99_SAPPC|nr:hypothetical protein SPRG_07944 [Saprolegnia parasitica CBS 223.65]KDO26542.1 hypothetical protein SPRG_07944 [Saprolegnia parasitica CBS 223.65]|eukprot:XP_012202685.1 hypothetical protein SPRG_07944 [Saprolegnia parasitica CBS 223.65]